MKIRHDFPDYARFKIRLQEVADTLPTWAGNAALNFYKDSFRRQGYINTGFTRWTARRSPDKGRAILVKTGALRRSLRLRVGPDWIEISTDSPYAKAHNEGGTITQTVTPRQRRFFWAMHAAAKTSGDTAQAGQWKAMALSTTINIKVPQRQFMDVPGGPPSRFLERRIVMHLERAFAHAIK